MSDTLLQDNEDSGFLNSYFYLGLGQVFHTHGFGPSGPV